jgi:hypothetical protein
VHVGSFIGSFALSNAVGYVQWVVNRLVSKQTSGRGILVVSANCNDCQRLVTYDSP